MKSYSNLIALCLTSLLAACDSGNSVEVPSNNNAGAELLNVVYFPDGGGVELPKPFLKEAEGQGWKAKEFTIDNKIPVLKNQLASVMEDQGYIRIHKIDLQGYEEGLSFAKPNSNRRVTFRMKIVKTAVGQRVLMRLSWNTN